MPSLCDVKGFSLENATANGPGTEMDVPGGDLVVVIWGNFDGATVTLEASPDNSTWITLTRTDGSAASYTVNTVDLVDRIATGMQVRANLASAGGSTDLNARFFP